MIKQALNIKSNITDFDIEEIISIVKRDRNKKRSFLLLNKLQSKHYPSDPLKTDKLFSQLADEIKSNYPDKENILVIGFAETAVSIGIYIADIFENSYYIQTTRETVPNKTFLTFDEQHSHAVMHRVYTDNLKEIIEQVDLVVIADDEFTTGNTAINLINTLKNNYKIQNGCDICMASILSCMKEENIYRLKENNINLITLVEAELNTKEIIFPNNFFNCVVSFGNEVNKKVTFHTIKEKIAPLFLTATKVLTERYNKFILSVFDIVSLAVTDGDVLIIGTEEFSFCALKLGIKLKEINSNICVQCTTQSPVLPSEDENYIINNRQCFVSLYDINRITYIYQMKHYDTVIVLTDCENPSEQAKKQLIDSINSDRIFFVQWRR